MSKSKRILIIGGVAGGASAAARARRLSEDAEIIVFEKGDHISFANCGLPYHISGDIKDRNRLILLTPEQLYKNRRIDARINSEVVEINRQNKSVTVVDHKNMFCYEETYTDLILSPGASPIMPNIPGINSSRIFYLRNINDMDAIIGNFTNSSQNISVVGAGFIGLEMVEALVKRGHRINLIERNSHVMTGIDAEMASLIHLELQLYQVNLYLNSSATKFVATDTGINTILDNGEVIKSHYIIMAAGVRPETALAKKCGLKIGSCGGILVNDKMQTNDPDIYAIGDAIETRDFISNQQNLTPLAGLANRQGRIAANNIFNITSTYKNTLATAICKIFNLTVARTGADEKTLIQHDINYEKIYLHPMNHASYYPNACPISIKLLFNPESGLILGAQAIGQDGVDKRIDILAVTIRSGLSVFDLEEMELAYAPPFGSAKDPINYAGFIAANVIRNEVNIYHANELNGTETLIDVRYMDELDAGSIPNAKHIPLEQLRERTNEIPRDNKIVVFCKEGLRAYQACKLLAHQGYDVANLSGGFKTYFMYQDINSKPDAIQLQEPSQNLAKIMITIDASGLSCPGPILRLKKAIARIKPGEALSIISTDPGFVNDVPVWCNKTGHQLLSLTPNNGRYQATVVKKSSHKIQTACETGV